MCVLFAQIAIEKSLNKNRRPLAMGTCLILLHEKRNDIEKKSPAHCWALFHSLCSCWAVSSCMHTIFQIIRQRKPFSLFFHSYVHLHYLLQICCYLSYCQTGELVIHHVFCFCIRIFECFRFRILSVCLAFGAFGPFLWF